MARDCFIARSGEREQAHVHGDSTFDEGPIGAEERALPCYILKLLMGYLSLYQNTIT
jgi:hypothetical protein